MINTADMMDITVETRITNSTELKYKIQQLQAKLYQQEERIKHTVKEIHYSFHLSNLVKSAVHNLNEDPEFKGNALEAALNFGGQFLLDKIMFRKGTGIKGYLVNAGLKKLLSAVISGKKDSILKRFGF